MKNHLLVHMEDQFQKSLSIRISQNSFKEINRARVNRGQIYRIKSIRQIMKFVFSVIIEIWRDVRAVEGGDLESRCRGNSTEGSNPSLSAIYVNLN